MNPRNPLESDRSHDPRTPSHERVYRALRSRMMHGIASPGASMTLRGIAAEFGVSMTPAREAVRRLATEGALKLSASGRITTPVLTGDRIEELAGLRALMEPELASRALPRAHGALIERMEQINNQVGAALSGGEASEYVRLNLEFHRTLYLRAQAPAMLALAETVWLQLGPTMSMLFSTERKGLVLESHRKILSALRAGDEPGLKLAVRSDVTSGLRMLLV